MTLTLNNKQMVGIVVLFVNTFWPFLILKYCITSDGTIFNLVFVQQLIHHWFVGILTHVDSRVILCSRPIKYQKGIEGPR